MTNETPQGRNTRKKRVPSGRTERLAPLGAARQPQAPPPTEGTMS